MATATATVRVGKLAPKQLAALRRRAERDGMTPGEYVTRLIEDDLEINDDIRTTSLHALAVPWREALKGKSEQELDALVKSARDRRRAMPAGDFANDYAG